METPTKKRKRPRKIGKRRPKKTVIVRPNEERSWVRNTKEAPMSRERLVPGLMTQIEELIADSHWSGQNKRKGFQTTKHLSMGRSIQALGATGFEHKHTWREGKGVYMGDICERYAANTFKGRLWRLAYTLLVQVDPWFGLDQDYVLQVSMMRRGDFVPKHIDAEDASYQLAFTLGKFAGGQLRVYDRQKTVDTTARPDAYDNRRKVLKFDGRYVHDVTPVTAGTRYSVIFYKTWDRRLRGPRPLLSKPSFL
jgi:hypothetical protein